jgi:hypothetical protein
MDDSEFEDAAELVRILGRMMKRQDWEGTPRVGVPSPAPAESTIPETGAREPQGNGAPVPAASAQQSPRAYRRTAEGPPIPNSPAQRGDGRSRSNSASQYGTKDNGAGSNEHTPRSGAQRRAAEGYNTTPRQELGATGGASQDTTPRARHLSVESGASTTPRAPQGAGGRSPHTPSTVRSIQQQPRSGGSFKGKSPVVGDSSVSQSAAATLATDSMRASPTLRRSPPLRLSPTHESIYSRQQK